MTEGDVGVKKLFSYEDARALLPEVRRLTEEAARQVEALGAPGEVAPSGAAQEKQSEIANAWAGALVEKGLQVKGLWLVDFDTGSGYYCWRYPEPEIQFYHSYEDGFRGRMRIQ